jgi:hypothetical protein
MMFFLHFHYLVRLHYRQMEWQNPKVGHGPQFFFKALMHVSNELHAIKKYQYGNP